MEAIILHQQNQLLLQLPTLQGGWRERLWKSTESYLNQHSLCSKRYTNWQQESPRSKTTSSSSQNDKVKDLNRHTLLHGECHVNEDTTIPIPLITTYGTGMPNITQIMHKHWPILMSSPLVKEILPITPTVAYRRSPNLKDQLVRAQVWYPPPEAETQYKEKRCTRLFCKYCIVLKNQMTYKCPHTGEIVTLAENVHCQSTNVVYLLYCKQHKTQYVGEIKRCFKIRLEEHLADIRHSRDKQVSNHYSSKPHSTKELEYYILAHLMGDPEKSQQRRRQTERNWIYSLKSFTPYGLNTMGK